MKVIINKTSQERKAEKTLQFIIDSNGGLTQTQIKAIKELIDGGYIEAINDYELKIHN